MTDASGSKILKSITSYRLQDKRQRHKEEQINPTMGEQQEKQLVQIFILTKLWLATKYTLPTQK